MELSHQELELGSADVRARKQRDEGGTPAVLREHQQMESESVEFGSSLPVRRLENRNPISIAMLFYVLTLAAIVAACLGKLSMTEGVTKTALGAAAAVGGVVGLLTGFLGGSFYFKSFKAASIGLGVGLVLGAVGGVLTVVRGEHFLQMMSIAFAGCWLMIVVMLLAARFQVR